MDSGALTSAIPENGNSAYPHSLMPLRGWLREAPVLVGRGSAWIAHMAVRARQEDREIWRSARMWLLETMSSTNKPLFEVIRFEWTDPANHLQINPP